MKVIIIATRADRPFSEFEPHMEKEAKQALTFMAEDFVREIYSRTDGKGAVMVCEGESEEAVVERLSQLPLVQAGLPRRIRCGAGSKLHTWEPSFSE